MLAVSVRGHTVEPGACVFVDGHTAGELRFGNVEDAAPAGLLISFGQTGMAPRPTATLISIAEIVLASEIGDQAITNEYHVGDRLIEGLSRERARVLSVDVDTADRADEVAVRLAHRGPDGSWSPTGERFVVPMNRVFPPTLFALIQTWRFMQPVDPLVDVIIDPVGENERLESSAILRLRDIEVPVHAIVTLEDHRVGIDLSAHYSLASHVGGSKPELLSDERLLPTAQNGECWEARVAVDGASYSIDADRGFTGAISVIPAGFDYTHSVDPIRATREIYVGAPIQAWTHPLLLREPAPNAMATVLGHAMPPPNSLQFLWIGERTVLYKPAVHAESGEDYLAVVRPGTQIDEHHHAVLGAFLGYITGGRARNVATEFYGHSGKLRTLIHDRGVPTSRRAAPVPLDRPTVYASLIARHIPTVLGAFGRWRETDLKTFEAVFHHYAEGVDSNYPVTRILRIAVALEAFINLVTRDFRENEAILDDGFVPLRDHLYASLADYAEQHRGVIGENAEKRLRTKLENLNSASNTKRIKAFWDAIPIVRAPEEDDLLRRLRNESVHRGFVGDDTTRDGIQRNAEDADRITDLFNRAVLVYAGYPGPIRSARGGRWIEPLSGELFHVPELPPRPTLEIRYEATIPPMTEAEARADAALAANQRDDRDEPLYVVDPAATWG